MTRKSGRKTWRPGIPRFRPTVEALEGRALMDGSGLFQEFTGPYQFATSVTTGTDGNLYVANAGYDGTGLITKVAPDGTPLETYLLPTGMEGFTIAAATDGGIWVQGDTAIVRLAPDGSMAQYTVRTGYMVGSTSLAAGPDGSAWFVNNGVADPMYAQATGSSTDINPASIGRIAPDGTITDFPGLDGTPSLVTAGPNGSAAFVITKRDGSVAIGQVTADGVESETPLSGRFGNMLSLTLGPDGDLWFLNDNNWTAAGLGTNQPAVIGRLTPSGTLATFPFAPNPVPVNSDGEWPQGGLIAAPDGNLDFVDDGAIGQVTTAGAITEVAVPISAHGQGDTIGPDGNLWIAVGDNSNLQAGLARFTIGGTDPNSGGSPPPVPPLTNPGSGQGQGQGQEPISITVPVPVDPIGVVDGPGAPAGPSPTPVNSPEPTAPLPEGGSGRAVSLDPSPATIVPTARATTTRPTPTRPPAPPSTTSAVFGLDPDVFIPLDLSAINPTAGSEVVGADSPAGGSAVNGQGHGHSRTGIRIDDQDRMVP